MRIRSGSTEPEGFTRNSVPGQSALSMGTGWFNGRLMKMFRSPRGQEGLTLPSNTDGRLSTSSEEEVEQMMGEELKHIKKKIGFNFLIVSV